MAQTSPDSTDINADSMTVSGASVTFNGLDDGTDDDDEGNALPESWVEGAIVTIVAPMNFLVSTSSGYSVLASNSLGEINPYPGMPVTPKSTALNMNWLLQLIRQNRTRYRGRVETRPA